MLLPGLVMRRPRAVLADEYGLVLEGLQHIIHSEIDVVGTATDGRTLVDLAGELHPDLVLTEATLPRLSGIEAVIRIKKKVPRVHAVFVTRHSDRQHLRDALNAGASGYLLKTCSGSEVLAALREILSGRCYITPLMTADLFSTFRESVRETGSSALTGRQREILQLIVEGNSLKEIASVLSISHKTVEYHKYNLMRTLGIRTNAELMQYAIQRGIVERLQTQGKRGRKTKAQPLKKLYST